MDALFGKLRADADVMDTTPAPLAKIPSLTKPGSIKVLKGSPKPATLKGLKASPKPVIKGARKPRAPRYRSKHEKLADKRSEQLLEKYKVFFYYFCITVYN